MFGYTINTTLFHKLKPIAIGDKTDNLLPWIGGFVFVLTHPSSSQVLHKVLSSFYTLNDFC